MVRNREFTVPLPLSAENTAILEDALTEKACKKIKILDEQEFTENDRDILKQESSANRAKGIAMANEICRKYRRDGRFFDEILKAGE